MERRNEHHQNYLASLLASTAPAQSGPDYGIGTYTQIGLPSNHPLSGMREQPVYTSPHANMNFSAPPGQSAHLMQMHQASPYPSHLNQYPFPVTTHYAGNSFITASGHPYEMRYETRHLPNDAIDRGRVRYPHNPTTDEPVPERNVIEEVEEEEEEAIEKPVRSLRRSRKTRTLTPILVFDNDSDDDDYKDKSDKKKRKKYDYDSEGAIDAGAAQSSSDDANEPAQGGQGEDLEEPKVKRKKISSKHRKNPRKDKTTDAKVKSEKASALLNRKGKGRPIPKTVQECDEADLMMWQWKHSGRSWKDIRKEWIRIMGVVPGRSSLSVRLAKMEDNFIDSGAGNDLMILKYKEEVEAELEDLKWKKVAQKIKEDTKVELKPTMIRKRYAELKDSGWVVGTTADGQITDEDDNVEDGEVSDDPKVSDHKEMRIENNAEDVV